MRRPDEQSESVKVEEHGHARLAGRAPRAWHGRRLLLSAALVAALAPVVTGGCGRAEEPSHRSVVVLRGDAYQRGYQHGQLLGDRIRSLFAGLLTTSILPYLNRNRPDIASVLWKYKSSDYDEVFSYQMMLEGAQNMEPWIPRSYLREMHGIADGAGIPYEQILILNTFVDTMLGFRSLTFFIQEIQSPRIVRIDFGDLSKDGIDNDGDGVIDQPGEGVLTYEPSFHASMVEVPADRPIKIVLEDQALSGTPLGVDPTTIRLQLDTTVIPPGDPSIATRTFMEEKLARLEATFTPPAGLRAGASVALLVQAASKTHVVDPPPEHARFMRDERITFTTKGFGKAPHQVPNRGESDGRTQPPSIAFAARGAATKDGMPVLGHHFGLLDSNTSHKHTVLFVHIPNDGVPHAVVGWAGFVGGFSGMNLRGLTFATNNSDSLDNPLVAEVHKNLVAAKLLERGLPVGIMGREILANCSDVPSALAFLRAAPRSYGWNVLLADASGEIAAAEMDSDFLHTPDGGFFSYGPEGSKPGNLDVHGQRISSIGDDDLEIASHFRRNVDDVSATIFGHAILPQRYWTSFFFRSLRAHYALQDLVAPKLGSLDVRAAEEILSAPAVVDQRDSMNAVVYEPRKLLLHYAMGQVPATSGPFLSFDLAAAVAGTK